jgi:Transposase DDE domain/Insertion element 4 transposase N-terminal
MYSTIREIVWDDKVCHHFDLGLVQEVIRPEQVQLVLHGCHAWEERERVLNMHTMIYWLIALALYPRLSQRAVYSKVLSGLRLLQPDLAQQVPVKSAFSYRREQLGLAALEWLFALCTRPQATSQTPGAFWKGMRLMAIDGTVDSVPDTQSNRAYFRYSSDDEVSRSPFPQVRLVLLVECGTHLICDVELSGCRQGETTSARELLARQLAADMLLLWDCGFHSSQLIFLARACQAHVLGRLKSNVLTKPIKRLSDGSYLTSIYEDQDHQCGERMLVRVISYTFTDPRIPGARETTHRLVTTLLDPEQYPAIELAALFHERWHVELVIDEVKTSLRLSARTLRSLTPEGVLQELYGLLLAHVAVRTLMLQAATEAGVAPTQLSFTGTVRILDESLPSLGLAALAHRAVLTQHLMQEIATQQLPRQRLRIQARVVKRVRSKYERKLPLHLKAPPLEAGIDFKDLIALVT